MTHPSNKKVMMRMSHEIYKRTIRRSNLRKPFVDSVQVPNTDKIGNYLDLHRLKLVHAISI